MTLLTGLDLDRKIAELDDTATLVKSERYVAEDCPKNGRYYLDGPNGIMKGHMVDGTLYRTWFEPHKDPTLALGLLEEMWDEVVLHTVYAPKQDRMVYHLYGRVGSDQRYISIYFQDFCTAIGNAYVQWKAQGR